MLASKIQGDKKVPDGGWGWMIVLAFAIANMLSMSTVNSFTLMFKDKFQEVGMSATDTTLIINTNSVIGMAMGVFVGPMLKLLGYRKVAFIGSFFFVAGVFLTAKADSLGYFLVTYSVACAIGLGLCSSAFPLAINTYFCEKRTRAFGIAVTIAGLGPIIFPQLISFFLYQYGVTWTCLLLGAVNLHIFAAAALLRPVRYHTPRSEKSIELLEVKPPEKAPYQPCSDVGITSDEPSSRRKRNYSIGDEAYCSSLDLRQSTHTSLPQDEQKQLMETAKTREPSEEQDQAMKKRIVKLFDLDLLKDVRFLNLLLGISIAVFAEINFSLLTPLILTDLGYSTANIAGFMSTLGTADILFRFCAPFIGERVKQTAQSMCTLSFVAAIVGRTLLIFCTNFQQLLGVAVGLGVAKGFRSVYLNLVIPNYLPLELLPSASGIQMVTKGIILLLFGPLLGVIRDHTGSYSICIVFINVVTFITVAMWTIEIVLMGKRKEKGAETQLS